MESKSASYSYYLILQVSSSFLSFSFYHSVGLFIVRAHEYEVCIKKQDRKDTNDDDDHTK